MTHPTPDTNATSTTIFQCPECERVGAAPESARCVWPLWVSSVPVRHIKPVTHSSNTRNRLQDFQFSPAPIHGWLAITTHAITSSITVNRHLAFAVRIQSLKQSQASPTTRKFNRQFSVAGHHRFRHIHLITRQLRIRRRILVSLFSRWRHNLRWWPHKIHRWQWLRGLQSHLQPQSDQRHRDQFFWTRTMAMFRSVLRQAVALETGI